MIDGVVAAENYWQRLIGLMGRSDLSAVRMWFPRCSSIHTCFMRARIDVAFLDGEGRVVSLREAVRPWRFVRGGRGACSVLEFPAGFAREHGITVGEIIQWQLE